MMNLPHSVLNLISWFCNFSDSEQGSKPKGFKDWLLAPLTALANMIVGVFITIGMAIVELFAIMIDFFATILMDILPILAYILWLIIRVLILILVWIIFVITFLVLVIIIGILGSFLLPFAIMLGWSYDYTVVSIKTEGVGMTITMGCNIFQDYSNFFKIWLPCLHFYFIVNNVSLVDVNIKFLPPSMNYISNSSGEDPGMSFLEQFDEKEIINTSFSCDNIKYSESKELRRENLPFLKSSGETPPDPFTTLDIFDLIISGMDDAFGAWSFIITLATVSLISGSYVDNVVVRTITLILPVIAFISTVLLSLTIQQYSKYETFLYLIGVSIVSIFTSLMIYKKGKPKAYNCGLQDGVASYSGLVNSLKDLNNFFEIAEDIGQDFAGVLNDVIWSDNFLGNVYNAFFDTVLLAVSWSDWRESLQRLEFASYLIPYTKSNWKSDVSKLAGYSFVGTFLLMVLAFSFLLTLPEANFEADKTNVEPGEYVNFTYTGSEHYCLQYYYWNFGDGSTSSIKNPSKKFENIGNYTISLTIVDYYGDFDDETKFEYIIVSE
jgi:hypothetical protein